MGVYKLIIYQRNMLYAMVYTFMTSQRSKVLHNVKFPNQSKSQTRKELNWNFELVLYNSTFLSQFFIFQATFYI